MADTNEGLFERFIRNYVVEGSQEIGIVASQHIAKKINKLTGLETRETVLGYIQRGGTPTPMDRILATRYDAYATELISKEKYGNMVALQKNKIVEVPLNQVSDKVRTVPENYPLINQARNMGTCLGDKICSKLN